MAASALGYLTHIFYFVRYYFKLLKELQENVLTSYSRGHHSACLCLDKKKKVILPSPSKSACSVL